MTIFLILKAVLECKVCWLFRLKRFKGTTKDEIINFYSFFYCGSNNRF